MKALWLSALTLIPLLQNTAFACGGCCCGGGYPPKPPVAVSVVVNNKNVLTHVLSSKTLLALATANPETFGKTDFRSVTVERTARAGKTQFTLSLEYEVVEEKRNMVCSLEATLTVAAAAGATVATLPEPMLGSLDCAE